MKGIRSKLFYIVMLHCWHSGDICMDAKWSVDENCLSILSAIRRRRWRRLANVEKLIVKNSNIHRAMLDAKSFLYILTRVTWFRRYVDGATCEITTWDSSSVCCQLLKPTCIRTTHVFTSLVMHVNRMLSQTARNSTACSSTGVCRPVNCVKSDHRTSSQAIDDVVGAWHRVTWCQHETFNESMKILISKSTSSVIMEFQSQEIDNACMRSPIAGRLFACFVC